MPMQLEAVLAKRERAEKEHMPARPPHVFVDGVYARGQATASFLQRQFWHPERR